MGKPKRVVLPQQRVPHPDSGPKVRVVWRVVLVVNGLRVCFQQVPSRVTGLRPPHPPPPPPAPPTLRYYELRLHEAQRLGVAAWVTETGSDQQLQLADQYLLTWMHWDYKWYRCVRRPREYVGLHGEGGAGGRGALLVPFRAPGPTLGPGVTAAIFPCPHHGERLTFVSTAL